LQINKLGTVLNVVRRTGFFCARAAIMTVHNNVSICSNRS